MRVGVLDVGSNTARLLVADVGAAAVEPVATARAYLGLGAEIADTGTLRRKTIAAAARVCRKYADRARELGVERAQVIVTAPGRQGAASAELVAALRERTRLPVRILSAEDEGRLAYDGAVARLVGASPNTVGVVDVGGGSTEIVVGRPGGEPSWLRSVDLGSLRLTRLVLASDPPSRRELAKARSAARAAFADLDAPTTGRRARHRWQRPSAREARRAGRSTETTPTPPSRSSPGDVRPRSPARWASTRHAPPPCSRASCSSARRPARFAAR